MWLKAAGSLLILLAAACLGFRAAASFAERPRQIRQIINCLSALKSQINYISSPLPEALVKCTGGVYGVVAALFQKTGNILSEKGWFTPREAFNLAYEQERGELVLLRPELELLEVAFANLGIVDRDEQQKSLNMIERQLIQIQLDAEKISAQNVKLYRYLGICGGLAVVIVLI